MKKKKKKKNIRLWKVYRKFLIFGTGFVLIGRCVIYGIPKNVLFRFIYLFIYFSSDKAQRGSFEYFVKKQKLEQNEREDIIFNL